VPSPLEGQDCLDVQVPAVSVQGCHYRDTRLAGDPRPLPVAPAVQKVRVASVLYAQSDPRQPPQGQISGRADLFRQDDDGRELFPQGGRAEVEDRVGADHRVWGTISFPGAGCSGDSELTMPCLLHGDGDDFNERSGFNATNRLFMYSCIEWV